MTEMPTVFQDVQTAWDAYDNRMAVGRFGWKANQPSVVQQVAAAFFRGYGHYDEALPARGLYNPQTECWKR